MSQGGNRVFPGYVWFTRRRRICEFAYSAIVKLALRSESGTISNIHLSGLRVCRHRQTGTVYALPKYRVPSRVLGE